MLGKRGVTDGTLTF